MASQCVLSVVSSLSRAWFLWSLHKWHVLQGHSQLPFFKKGEYLSNKFDFDLE